MSEFEEPYEYKRVGVCSKGKYHVGELLEEIERLWDVEPKDRRKTDRKVWVERMNNTVKIYNKAVGWNCFKKVKV